MRDSKEHWKRRKDGNSLKDLVKKRKDGNSLKDMRERWKSGRKNSKKQYRKLPGELAVLLAVSTFFLWGCTARELESRRFPLALEVGSQDGKLTFARAWPYVEGETQPEEDTDEMNEIEISENINKDWRINNDKITEVLAGSVDEAIEKIQNLQDKYVDYSQVKAILWDRSLDVDGRLGIQVLEWLERNPVFARNILIFDADREKLSLELVQKQARGQPGIYLENLYRNNTDYKETTKTLEELLYGEKASQGSSGT